MTINDFAKSLNNLESAMIFCHARPDGDTLSCAFALYYAFKKSGKKVSVVCPTPVQPLHCGWIPFLPETTPSAGYDGYISVDTPTEDLMGGCYDFFRRQRKTFILDHHMSSTRFAKTCLVIDNPACAMNVYEVIKAMGIEIDSQIAHILLYGIVTDTGNFSHANLPANTFSLVSELIRKGADHSKIYDDIYRHNSKAKVQLYAASLSKIRYFYDDRLAILTINKDDLQKVGAYSEMTEGFVDYLLTVESVEVAVSVLEHKNNLYRVSFRSKKVNVNEIAGVFGGGGHALASGAVIAGYYEDVIDKIVFNVGNYIV